MRVDINAAGQNKTIRGIDSLRILTDQVAANLADLLAVDQRCHTVDARDVASAFAAAASADVVGEIFLIAGDDIAVYPTALFEAETNVAQRLRELLSPSANPREIEALRGSMRVLLGEPGGSKRPRTGDRSVHRVGSHR